MKKLIFLLLFIPLVFSCSSGEESLPPPEPIKYTLTTSSNPSEGGTVTPPTGQHNEGTTVNITATPSAEYNFKDWTGLNGSSNIQSIVMNSDKTVTANFVKKKYPLSLQTEGEGTISEKVIQQGSANSTDYNSGTIVELTATPSSEWEFKEWKGDLTGTENPKQITIDKPKTVTAVFVRKQYILTIEIEGDAGNVSVDGTVLENKTSYNVGTIIELTANNESTWFFREWKGDLTGSDNPKQITMDKAKTITAVFKEAEFYLADNGVTVKCQGTSPGDKAWINDKWYYSVDNEGLKSAAKNSTNTDLTCLCTSNVTTMKELFQDGDVTNPGPKKFNQDISSWDTGNVVDMSFMFWYATSFNQDISNWDVSNVKYMNYMFYNAHAFNQDIGNWDVSEVMTFGGTFNGASSFNQNLNKWDVSGVYTDSTNSNLFRGMTTMFYQSNFNGDISNWDVSNVGTMDNMFTSSPFNQDISNWDTGNVVYMSGMFSNTPFNQDISNWNVSNVRKMNGMFAGASSFNQNIGNWDVSKVEEMISMFGMYEYYINGVLQPGSIGAISFNQDIGSWNVGNVKFMYSMFEGATAFNQDIGDWDVSKVTRMEEMFMNATNFNQDIGDWDVSKVTRMDKMFKNATSFNKYIGDWKTDKLTKMESIFEGATSFNQNLEDWEVSGVGVMKYVFKDATAFNGTLNKWDVRGSNLEGMFKNATSFNQNIKSWNLQNASSFKEMFMNATNFNQDISTWYTNNVNDMSFMFNSAENFNQDLTNWCVKNISSEPDSFSTSSALTEENKPKWGESCN